MEQNTGGRGTWCGAMTRRRRTLFLFGLLAALMIPLFVWIPMEWRHDPLIGPLGSRYHIGLFLALTLLLYNRGPLKGRLKAVVAVCCLLGAATELLQTRFGRTASLKDWLLDAQGVGFALCWIWYRRTGRRALPLLSAVVLAALVVWPLRQLPITVQEYRAAQTRFPILEDFERPRALVLWSRPSDIDRTLVHVPGRGQVLQIDSRGDERWPGVSSRQLPYDWSRYTELRVDCRLVDPSPDSLLVTIQLEDRAAPGDVDIAMMSFRVGHQWQTLAVPLADLVSHNRRRAVPGREILAVAILATRSRPGPISLQIDNLRLAGDHGGGSPEPMIDGRD